MPGWEKSISPQMVPPRRRRGRPPHKGRYHRATPQPIARKSTTDTEQLPPPTAPAILSPVSMEDKPPMSNIISSPLVNTQQVQDGITSPSSFAFPVQLAGPSRSLASFSRPSTLPQQFTTPSTPHFVLLNPPGLQALQQRYDSIRAIDCNNHHRPARIFVNRNTKDDRNYVQSRFRAGLSYGARQHPSNYLANSPVPVPYDFAPMLLSYMDAHATGISLIDTIDVPELDGPPYPPWDILISWRTREELRTKGFPDPVVNFLPACAFNTLPRPTHSELDYTSTVPPQPVSAQDAQLGYNIGSSPTPSDLSGLYYAPRMPPEMSSPVYSSGSFGFNNNPSYWNNSSSFPEEEDEDEAAGH